MQAIKITEAQITALETAGIFECPVGDDEIALNSAISGNRMIFEDASEMSRIVCDVSNRADELAETEFCGVPELRAMYAKDSRVLGNLMMKLSRLA